VTVQLDATGNASITPAQVNNGSNDACGIASLSLDNTTFNCANVNGNTVTLTVGRERQQQHLHRHVSILDSIAPNALCQDVDVQLDATGNGSTTAAASQQRQQRQLRDCQPGAQPNRIHCLEVGANTETLTVTDVNGNVSTCTTVVTVIDSIAPTAICQNITAYLDSTGFVQIAASMINNGSFDNCAVDTIFHSMCDFYCENVGPNTVTLTVVDVNGNSSTCTSVVTVIDNLPPASCARMPRCT
jgi:hypothetical protein